MKKLVKIGLLFCVAVSTTSCISTNLLDLPDDLARLDKTANSIVRSVESIERASQEITPEDEYYLGRTIAAIILKQNKLYSSTKKVQYLNKICSALVVNSEKPYLYNGYKVAILDSKDLNAISTPGGHIFISKALYDLADSEDVLAAILAHEIAHIQLGHSIQSVKTARVTEAVIATADALDRVLSDEERSREEEAINKAASEYVDQLINQGFSRDQEFKADAYAAKLLLDAGYDPKAMLDLLKILVLYQDGSTTLDKTHPTPDKRVKKINDVLKAEPYASCKANKEDRMARFKQYR